MVLSSVHHKRPQRTPRENEIAKLEFRMTEVKKLGIIGLGLMGGSLGLAVKRNGMAETVCGYARRKETRQGALERGAVDNAVETPQDAVKDADIAVFCVPVLAMPALLECCKPYFADSCIVTDVGSTKAELVSQAAKLFEDIPAVFVGSHPMAGSEKSGLDAATSELYDGATVIVTTETPGLARESGAVDRIARFWQKLGGKVTVMSPEQHDEIIARTSHLPHLVAAALVNSVRREGGGDLREFCARGFGDTTRIAGASETIWHDIVKSNRVSVSRELAEFGKALDGLRRMVDTGDFEGVRGFLAQARRWRQEFGNQSGGEK